MDLRAYRSSIRQQVSLDIRQALGYTQQKTCCQKVMEMMDQVVDEAVVKAYDSMSAETHNITNSVNHTIQEQDEGDNVGLDATIVQGDETTIANLMTAEVWMLTDSYKIAEVRQTRAKESDTFKNTMLWLDEILASAKAEFSSPDIMCLPKTPAAKKKKRTPKRESSIMSVDPTTIERPPTGRARRAAAVNAIKRMGEAGSPKRSLRLAKSKKSSAIMPDEDDVFSPPKSIPKKIARFSRLPHVKDKVDAFEKISDSPTAERVKPTKKKKVTKSASAISDVEKAKGSSPPAPICLSDGDHTPLVHKTVFHLHSSTPAERSSALANEATLTKQLAVRSRVDPAVASDTSMDAPDDTPQTVKKVTKTKQKVLSVSKQSRLSSPAAVRSEKATKSKAADTAPQNEEVALTNQVSSIVAPDILELQSKLSSPATVGQSVTKDSVHPAVRRSRSGIQEQLGASEEQAKSVTSKSSTYKSKATTSPATSLRIVEKVLSPVAASSGGSTDSVMPADRAMEITDAATAGETEKEIAVPVDMETANQPEDMEFVKAPKPMERPIRSTRTKTRQQPPSTSSTTIATDAASAPVTAESSQTSSSSTAATKSQSSAKKGQPSKGEDGERAQPASDRADDETLRQLSPSLTSKPSDSEPSTYESTQTVDVNPPPAPERSQPQRTTRSKMRAAPPTTTVSDDQKSPTKPSHPVKLQSPARSQSPSRSAVKPKTVSRTRIVSADRVTSGKESSTIKRKPYSDSNHLSGGKRPRTSSDSSAYAGSVVRTLTKAASVSRINKNTNQSMGKLQTTVSTPDMSRSHSMIKTMMKSGGRISPQGTPSLGKSVLSFLSRATPQKAPSREEVMEVKEQKLKEKQLAEKQRRDDAERLRLQQAEAKKRERMEKMQKVQEARQAKLQAMREKQQEIEKKSQQKTEYSNLALERKQKEEKERAQLRDQKLQEAEERRRKEEEKRQKRIRANELEQKRIADAKRVQEEAERQKKEAEKLNAAKSGEKAKQEAMAKLTEKKTLQGKTPTPAPPPPLFTSKQTSIYEVISNKTAALSEERALLRAAINNAVPSAKHNSTFTVEDEDFIDLDLIEEDDEFEDPKFAKCKKPKWAQGHEFSAAIINQYTAMKSNPRLPAQVFGIFERCTPDLTKIFPIHKPRFFKRTSSANWSSPPLRKSGESKRKV